MVCCGPLPRFKVEDCFQPRKEGLPLGDKGAGLERSVGVSGSYPSPGSHLGPVPLKGGYFCSSTEQPGLVFIIACVEGNTIFLS